MPDQARRSKTQNIFGATVFKLQRLHCFSWIITSKLVFQGTINCYVWQLSILKMLIRAPECDYFGGTRSHKPVRCYYPFHRLNKSMLCTFIPVNDRLQNVFGELSLNAVLGPPKWKSQGPQCKQCKWLVWSPAGSLQLQSLESAWTKDN